MIEITDELVEKARKEYERALSFNGWANERGMRAALEAVAPDIAAQAIEDAIDRMGWPEIHAFHNELGSGQDVREDAGGYFIRSVKALFGIKRKDPVTSYRDAARAMVNEARANATREKGSADADQD